MPSKASTMGGNQSAEELRRELAKALEQHAATAAILRVISGSPTDLRGVFAEIAAGAARLCDANDAVIRQVDGEVLRLVAHHGPLPTPATLPLSRNLLTARAVLDRRTIHLADLQAEDLQRAIAAIQGHLQQEGIALGQVYPEGSDTALQLGHRTVLCVPLLHAGEAIGAILIRRTEVRPFNDREIDLLKTFADQAVIAIENARLFEAEQASKRELQESLEYQTAISDVLGVISRSPTNLQPVFDTIAQSAAQLCEAQFCHVCRFDGKLIHFGAAHGLTPEGRHALQNGYPLAPGRATATARSILSGSVEEIPDVHTDPEYGHGGAATVMNVRSVVAVPMLKDNHPIGAIGIARSTTGRFSTRQIGLLKTFADQAVIAIENTRLFEAEQASKRELQKTLEYQKAISGVLGAISRSPSQLQPVFDVIVTSSKRLLRAYSAIVSLVVGDQLTLGAFTSLGPESDKWLKDQYPLQLGGTSNAATVVRTQKPLMVEDTETDSRVSELARRRGFRSLLMVPMMCQGRAIGTINVTRPNPGPFSQEESELLKTFADQAVIGIENTRLFDEVQARTRELTESLEQQTATADVLKVISRSALNVEKVLDALVESAARLCDAYDAAILQVFGDCLRLVAHHGQIPTTGPVGQYTLPLTRGRVFGRAVLDRRTIHVADILAEADEYPETRNTALRLGFRTVLTVPLVHAGEAIGVILIRRAEVRPFTERQIELVNTFADQAVIAIENTRLFEEVQVRTKDLAKTVEDLEIASQHKNQFVANMSHELRTPLAAILGYAELIQEGFYEPQGPKSVDALTRIRSNGKHLLGLINTVLDIAKIESGQFTLNMAEYAIESVIETVRSATEALAQNKKLALTTEVPKSLPIGLGDEQRLTQVLLNLVGNAIKFTDAGEVRVTVKAVNGHFNVTVADTGPGIPPAEQTRIFEQFHQVDSSLTKAKGGTGLGLAIARQIVEMHGGRIWVESTVGKGSTFQMEIPSRAEFRKRAL